MPLSKPTYRRLALAAAIGLLGAGAATAATAQPAPQHTAAAPSGLNGPYLYLGWGSPPKATDVMSATGTTQFTMAFMLSDGGCNPKWDGSRALTGGNDQSTINSIRSAGGDVTVSFGGWSGNKLGEKCSSASALAGAYQKVIDAYQLKSIDIDIEASEFENATVRQRVVDALKTVKQKNSGIKVYVTFGTTTTGPDANGKDLVKRGATAGLDVDGWAVMPFDFGQGSIDMAGATKSAVDGLKNTVASAYGLSSDAAYRKVGFSSMNGKTDVAGETISLNNFKDMVSYAKSHHLARVSFWSLNRDRKCGSGTDGDACSGIDQGTYDFTKVLAGYNG
ncbi:chitinase [Streptomyces violaceusniger]|uniref:Chitinase n=3 Tax=Streptomyces TaxID=1883 RepID=A0ABD5J940_9ACTN|nr:MULTISPECIES: chitinase [Streptomyces]KUL44964.1 chitinase [Streptomyces violaceusniger]MEE4584888.1 chitinase [Streptomyces sp. DSM 41602]WTB05420.1 chitinase [Streptomyces antimycoticus]